VDADARSLDFASAYFDDDAVYDQESDELLVEEPDAVVSEKAWPKSEIGRVFTGPSGLPRAHRPWRLAVGISLFLLATGIGLVYLIFHYANGQAGSALPLDYAAPPAGSGQKMPQVGTERSSDSSAPGEATGGQDVVVPAGEEGGVATIQVLPPIDVETPAPEPALDSAEAELLWESAPESNNQDAGSEIAAAGKSFIEEPQAIPEESQVISEEPKVIPEEPQVIPEEKAEEPVPLPVYLINFSFDSDALIPDSLHVLDSVVVKLEENPASVASITGFTDNLGDKQYNLELSRKRADAVEQYLVAAGVAKERLSVEGRGVLTEPIENSQTDSAHSMEPYRIVQIELSSDRPR